MRPILVILALLIPSVSAWADDKGDVDKAKEFYDKSNAAFQDGKYEEAARLMSKAYFHVREPNFVYNIAFSLDQGKQCSEALYQYRRFLFLQPKVDLRKNAENRVIALRDKCPDSGDSTRTLRNLRKAWEAHQEKRCRDAVKLYKTYLASGKVPARKRAAKQAIEELSATCPKKQDKESKQTQALLKQCLADAGDCLGEKNACQSYLQADDAKQTTAAQKQLKSLGTCNTPVTSDFTDNSVHVGLNLGGVLASLSSLSPDSNGQPRSVNIPALFSFGVFGGYEHKLGSFWLGGAAKLQLTPLQYRNTVGSANTLSWLVDGAAFLTIRYDISERFLLRGELGGGLTLWAGLKDDNPFTENGQGTSGGPLSFFSIDLGMSSDFRVTNNIAITARLGYMIAPGLRSKDLAGNILHRIEGLVGARFSF